MKRHKLIEYRGKRTQDEMTKKYGISQQAWDSWEHGRVKPSLDKAMQLEIDSGIPMEEMFADVFEGLSKG